MQQLLQHRYNDDFFSQAELRREKLDYVRLNVGKITDEKSQHHIDLLFQAHQCYYFGFFKAMLALCGSLLEQSIHILYDEYFVCHREVRIDVFGKKYLIKNAEGLAQFDLSVLIKNAGFLKIIPQNYQYKVYRLKQIRNCAIHDILPAFGLIENRYVAQIDKKGNMVKIDKEEIDEHVLSTNSEEIFAYYVLTRTREFIKVAFENRVKRLPPEKV